MNGEQMSNELKKDVVIKIKGTQITGGDKDVVELMTTGSFCRRDNSYYIIYDESEATGFAGAKTVLRYDQKANQVTMSRTGSNRSQLIIEKGRRHQCSYETDYGNLMVGVLGSALKSSLDDNGGRISFGYSLDINTSLTSENIVDIVVADKGSSQPQAER